LGRDEVVILHVQYPVGVSLPGAKERFIRPKRARD